MSKPKHERTKEDEAWVNSFKFNFERKFHEHTARGRGYGVYILLIVEEITRTITVVITLDIMDMKVDIMVV